jgi:hypothetical protein
VVPPYVARGGIGPVSAEEVERARLRVAGVLDPWRRRVYLLRVYARAVRDYFT